MTDTNPTAVFVEDAVFEGIALTQILKDCGCEPLHAESVADLAPFLDSLPRPPDLIVLRIGSDPGADDGVRAIRSTPRGRLASVLAVLDLDVVDVDLEWLRAVGVSGVVGADASVEMVERRIRQITRPGAPRRACERVACCLPIEVRHDGQVLQAVALTLGARGVRLAIEAELGLNDLVELRFRLPMVTDKEIEATARVMNRSPYKTSTGGNDFGLFLFPVDDETQGFIEAEVQRLLSLG